jgi:hypothetical protein
MEQSICAKGADFAREVTRCLDHFIVLRALSDLPPAKRLGEFCSAVLRGGNTDARFDALCSSLLELPCRRVSGDIFKDFIFSALLEQPNRYAQLAAAGRSDPPLKGAVERDLRLAQKLFNLTRDQLLLCALEAKEKPPEAPAPQADPREESIARMASSAWGIRSPRPKAAPEKQPETSPEPDFSDYLRWTYDEPEQRAPYAADEGLAVLYRLFLAEEDWGRLAQPLYDFHARYGCGEFLQHRVFVASDEGFCGIEAPESPEWDSLVGIGRQKERLYANALRFLHTGKGDNMLLYGASGSGKSSAVLALLQELPDLRLVFLSHRGFEGCVETIRTLQQQPLHFLALMDDLSISEREYKRLKAALATLRTQGNVLLCATSSGPLPDQSVFPLSLVFEPLSEEQFFQNLSELLRLDHVYADELVIQRACADQPERSMRCAAAVAHRLAQLERGEGR